VGRGDEVCMQTTTFLTMLVLFSRWNGHDTLRGGAPESEVKVEERSGISHIRPDGGMAVLKSHVSGQLGNSWSGPLLRMGMPLPYRMSLVSMMIDSSQPSSGILMKLARVLPASHRRVA
jgi:hypothetical protein